MVLSNKQFSRLVITDLLFMEAHMPKFGHVFYGFFFKVQHREEEYCDDYFVRFGSQKIWHVKLLNKVANVLAIQLSNRLDLLKIFLGN